MHTDNIEFILNYDYVYFVDGNMCKWIRLGKTYFDHEVKGVAELVKGHYVIKTSEIIKDKEARKKIVDALKLDENTTFSNKRYRIHQVTLTGEELDVVDDYIFKKACRLKDSGLDDSKCYQALMSVHRKLQEAKKKCKS